MPQLELAVVSNNIRRRDGEGRWMLEIARSLLERGHHVTAFASTCDQELIDQGVRWVPVRRLGGPDLVGHLSFARASSIAMARQRFDVVATMGPCAFSSDKTCFVAAFSQRGWQASWAQGTRPDPYRRIHSKANGFLERRALSRASCLVSISSRVEGELRPLLAKGAATVVAPGGLDLGEFPITTASSKAHSREVLGLREEAFVCAFVGEYASGRKGLTQLLQAFALGKDGDDVLVISGHGPVSKIRTLLSAKGMDDKVVFADPDLPVQLVYASADICAVPSLYEPFSLVAVEAAACGIPVLISERAGAAEYLVPEGGAVAVDPLDVETLLAEMRRLKNAPVLAARMGIQARAASEKLDWPIVSSVVADAIEATARVPESEGREMGEVG